MKCSNRRVVFWLLVVAMLLSEDAWAVQEEPEPNDLFALSLEKLMNVPVASVSRLPTHSRYLSAPVTIITAEDIHYSGLTAIPEILQFTPGMDVRRLDRQRHIVGVRGLFGVFSDRTLILIDGRTATDPVFGTTHWENLPVLVEDIERIEVVRGPVGAAWGANAFTGVINIITKKAAEYPGGLISTTVNEFGDTCTHLRYGQTRGQWSWKATAGYQNAEDSDAAGAGRYISGGDSMLDDSIGFSGFSARDWGRSWKFNTQAEYRLNDKTSWNFGMAHSSGQEGDYEFMGVFPRRDILTEYTRMFARMDHKFDEDTSGRIQWFGNYLNKHRRVVTDRTIYLENDIEAQLIFKPDDNHTASVGGNARWTRINTHNHSAVNEHIVGDADEYWTGIFLLDRWIMTDRLTLEGQFRLDHYSATTTDWSTRLTALYALDEQQHHILRAGFARAFRSPSLILRNLRYQDSLGFPPFNQTAKVHNEGTYALEAGYGGELTDNLLLNIDAYYQRFERLIGSVNPMVGPIMESMFKNIAGADSWGAETSLSRQHKMGKITAWYAYNALATDEFGQNTRSIFPSEHKTGLSSRWYLDKEWTLNTNYVFQNAIRMVFGDAMNDAHGVMKDAHSIHRLDLTLSYKFAEGKGELLIGVTDVLNKTTDAVFDTGYFTALETPGRTFFGRLQIKF